MDNHIQMNLQLFSEEVADTSVDTTAEVESTPVDSFEAEWQAQFDDEPTQEAEPEFDYKPFLDRAEFKHNGEVYKYDNMDSLIEDAQKGKDYDRIRTKYDEQKNDPLSNWAKSYMENAGFNNVNDFLQAVQRSEFEGKVEQYANQLVNEGWDMAQAKLHASAVLRNQQSEAQQQAKSSDDQRRQNLSEFAKFYEQQTGEALTMDNMPSYVQEWYNNGELDKITADQMELAYYRNNIDNIKSNVQQETIKNLESNKQASTGSLTTNTHSNETNMSAEQIANTINSLPPSQVDAWIDKNYEMIEKSGYFKLF